MRASHLLLAGLGLGAMVALGACTPQTIENRVDLRTPAEKAAACVAQFETDGKAPQIMTYDSKTKTEVHVNTDGRDVDVTAQNATDNTSMGMGGRVGGNIPEACTDATPIAAPAIPSRPKSSKRMSWGNNN